MRFTSGHRRRLKTDKTTRRPAPSVPLHQPSKVVGHSMSARTTRRVLRDPISTRSSHHWDPQLFTSFEFFLKKKERRDLRHDHMVPKASSSRRFYESASRPGLGVVGKGREGGEGLRKGAEHAATNSPTHTRNEVKIRESLPRREDDGDANMDPKWSTPGLAATK